MTTRFRILDELGSGAMGVVYRAADTADAHRLVALKIVKVAGTVTPAQRLIFKEEFRAMTRLKHPNTIEVIDYGMLDEQTQFIAMELVAGQDLSSLLAAGRLPIAKVYPLVIQLLQALEFIHARLYVHRDIKSQNIRVLADGTLKLMDFGLMSQMGLPANGRVTGTPGYLAPEVVKGGMINASTDLYAVGCLIYELVTGRLPFVGKLLDVVRAHVGTQPEPLDRHAPDVPARLAQIVARLLEKEQSARYQDAAAVIDDLAELAGFAVTASNLGQKKSYLTASVLVARDAELATLAEALGAIGQGEGRAILVGAPAGTGKSRLVQELLLQAKLDERPVLLGRCAERGRGPYDPLIEALRTLVTLSTAEELALAAPVMARLMPELGTVDALDTAAAPAGPNPAAAAEADTEKKRLHETFAAWIGAVSRRRPLVLCLDDLHWADTGTLDALNYLLRQQLTAPIFVLGTYRSDEVPEGSPLRFALQEGLATPLTLAPFGREQVLALIQALLHRIDITPAYLDALYGATAGNAFFVTEILRTLIEEHALIQRAGTWHFPSEAGPLLEPTSVEATVRRRLASLSRESRTLAEVAAVMGRSQSLEMLQALSQTTDERLFDALDELIERQFILYEHGQTSFPHDRVRDALNADIASDRRAQLHQRAGEYLETRGASDAELAHHFAHGTDRTKAYRYLRAAGDACAAAGAPDAALAYWEDADAALATLQTKQREAWQVALWWDIGQLAFYARPATAIAAFERLIPLLEARCSVDSFVKLLRRVAPIVQRLPAGVRGRMMARAQVYRPYKYVSARGLGRLSPIDLPAALGRVIESYGYMAVAYAYAGETERGLATARKAIQMAPYEGTGLPFEGVQLMVIAPILLLMGRIDEAIDVALRAAPLVIDHSGAIGRLTRISYAASVGTQLARALQGQRPDPLIEAAAVQACEAAGTLSMINEVLCNGAVVHAWTGRHQEARAYIERMAQQSRELSEPPFPFVLYLRPYMLWQEGAFAEALALTQQAIAYPHVIKGQYRPRKLLELLQGHIQLDTGNPEAAMRTFDAVIENVRLKGTDQLLTMGLLGRARAALAAKEPATARTDLEEALGLAVGGPARNPLHEGTATRLMAGVARQAGELDGAHQWLDRAMSIHEQADQDNPIGRAHVHLARGHVCVLQGETEAAEKAFRVAGEGYLALHNRYFLHLVTVEIEHLRHPVEVVKQRVAPAPELVMEKWANLMRM